MEGSTQRLKEKTYGKNRLWKESMVRIYGKLGNGKRTERDGWDNTKRNEMEWLNVKGESCACQVFGSNLLKLRDKD